jgi:3-(3-hydroxy-phenyl)propionate hydroxylase
VVLGVGCTPPDVDGAEAMTADVTEAVRARYLGDAEAAVYLVRPDQVVAGRWVSADAAAVEKAIAGVWRTA